MPQLRHSRVSLSPISWAWRFMYLNLFQIASALYFGIALTLAVVGASPANFTLLSKVGFGLAFLSYTLLLVAPVRRWVRAFSVIAPLLAVMARLAELYAGPAQPLGIVTWLFLGFVWTWGADRLMPPPLSNGQGKRWLYEAGA